MTAEPVVLIPVSPLTPPDCDLRGLPFMPLDVVRLIDSDLAALSTGDEFKAAVTLWCKAWLQVPAASLPDDDRILAHLSGAGPRWRRLKDMALRGFVLCSDGRWYHSVIAEKAAEAWAFRLKQRAKSKRRWDKPEDGPAHPAGDPADDAAAFPRDMQGTGTGTGTYSDTDVSGGEPPKSTSPNDPDALAWSEARRLLIDQGGMTKATAGTFFGKLLTEHGLTGRDLLGPIADGFGNGTGDPKSWLSAAAKTRSRKRVPPSRTPDLGYC